MPLLTPEFVRIAGLVTGIIVTVIAVYKFVIQRPRLQLTAEHNRDFFYGDLVRTNLQFFISNHGLRYAEDVYIEIYLPDWNFGEPRRKIEIGTTVSTIEDGERTVHETYGSHHDPDSENSDNGEDDNPLPDIDGDSEDRNTQIEIADSILDLRHDLQPRFLASGEKNHIFVEDTLYNGTRFNIFTGNVNIEQFRSYTIEYRVGCKTYGPRKGEIEIESRYDDFRVSHTHPRFYNVWINVIKKAPMDLLSFFSAVLRDRTGVDLSRDAVSVERDEIEYGQESEDERLVTPVAWIKVSSRVDSLQSVTAKLTLYGYSDEDEGILGSVTFSARALSPGEHWETRPPRRQHRSHLIDYNIEYRDSYTSPAIPIRIDEKSTTDIEIEAEWEVETEDSYRGNLRGLSKKDCSLNKGTDESAGHRPVSVEGELVNENTVPVTVSVVAKFYTADDVVLTTPYNRETIPADGTKDFQISADLGREQEERIESCDVVLVQGT